MYSKFQKEEPSSLTNLPLFIRRPDLSSRDRHKIGVTALLFKKHGIITQLSRRYKISRQFVYDLRDYVSAQNLFEKVEAYSNKLALRRQLLRVILCLRLVCISTLSGIGETLKILGLGHRSMGYLSEELKMAGNQLDNTISHQGSLQVMSDEIFITRNRPILVTVEWHSGCILRLELIEHSLNKKVWVDHWAGIEANGMKMEHLTNDEGRFMYVALLESRPDLPRQMDTFHTIAKQLGIFRIRYENLFDKAFDNNEKRLTYFFNAVERNQPKRMQKTFVAALNAEQALEQAIIRLETFEKFYFQILQQLQIFRSDGQLRTFQFAKQQILNAVNALRAMQTKTLKKVLDEIEKKIDDLLLFFKRAPQIYHQVKALLPKHLIAPCCLLWQWKKNLAKAKSTKHRKYAAHRIQQYLLIVKGFCQQLDLDFQHIQQLVDFRLDNIIQSSALVEAINALLRPYLDRSKGQITQQHLNLIMFYLNHRTYPKRCKRGGKSPIEILTGKKVNKNPIDLLVDKILPA